MLYIIQQWGSMVVGVLAAVSIVVGAHIALKPNQDQSRSHMVSRVFAFGTGAFFTAVCMDFLPDAWSGNGDKAPLWIFLGALAMWAATHLTDSAFVRDQHQQLAASSSLASGDSTLSFRNTTLQFTRVSAIILAGALSFHTFLEGAAVSFTFHDMNWTTLGFAFAMILHKLPEGVLWGLALGAVFPRDLVKIKRILLIPAVCTVLGAFLGIFLASQASTQVVSVATGLVAGAMFYIAFAELLPTLRESPKPRLVRSWFVIGVVIMFSLNMLSSLFGG